MTFSTTEFRYYRDPNYYDWILITEGTPPMRRTFETEADLARYVDSRGLKPERINPPKLGNNEEYIDEQTHRWRIEPARQPSLFREYMHAVLGLAVGGFGVFGLFVGGPLLIFALAINGLAMVKFLAYEITEGLRLTDDAYRDIGGEKVGWLLSVIPGGVVYGILALVNAVSNGW